MYSGLKFMISSLLLNNLYINTIHEKFVLNSPWINQNKNIKENVDP